MAGDCALNAGVEVRVLVPQLSIAPAGESRAAGSAHERDTIPLFRVRAPSIAEGSVLARKLDSESRRPGFDSSLRI